MFNYQQFTLILLAVINLTSSRNLINLNVNTIGSKTFGSFKLPSVRIEIDFHLDLTDSNGLTVNFNSYDLYPINLIGKMKINETADGSNILTGQLVSSSGLMVNLTSKMTPHGQLTSSRIDFNLTHSISGTYLIEVNQVDSCGGPYIMNQTLTTNPPGLINYQALLSNLCLDKSHGKDLKYGDHYRSDLSSTKWPWLNSTFDHYTSQNLTNVHERLEFKNDKFGHLIGLSDWIKGDQIFSMRKSFTFNSKSNQLSSFRIDKMTHGNKTILTIEPLLVDKPPSDYPGDDQVTLNGHANDPSIW